MWDLAPWPGIKHGPPALGEWRPSHWVTRKVQPRVILYKGTTEDGMVGWHHRLSGHGFGWTPGVGDGQGGLACFGSWGHKELDMTE